MDMAQGGVDHAAFFQGFGVDRPIGPRLPHLAVDAQQVRPAVLWRGKARQRVVLPVGSGEGAAVDHTAQLGQLYRPHLRRCKDMYIVRPIHRRIGRFLPVIVVVARGDEHRHGHVPQRLGQRPDGLGIDPLPIQQVAGEQHQVHPLLPGQTGQAGGKLPQLPPALGAFFPVQAGHGGVQVKIGGVE